MKTAILTATVAFVAAICAQWISHLLTKLRARTKENNEIIQELILPNINDVILYLETATHYRKEHDVEAEIKPEEITERIKGNIKYGNSELVNALYNYQHSITYFDGKGDSDSKQIFELFFVFLKYAKEILKKSSYTNDYLLELIDKSQKLYGISYVLLECNRDMLFILSHSWLWEKTYITTIPEHTLDSLILDKDLEVSKREHLNLVILNIIRNAFMENDSINDYTELIEKISREND